MVPQYVPYWRTTGLLLGVSGLRLEIINMNFPSVNEKCFQMLLYWLRTDRSATWKTLITVVDHLEDTNGRYSYVCLHAYV